jgi:hypothetical protein
LIENPNTRYVASEDVDDSDVFDTKDVVFTFTYNCHPGNAFPHGTNDLTGENLEKSLLNAIRGKK